MIVVELESGLRFSLEQESKVLDPVSGVGFVYPFVEPAELIPVFKSADEPNLLSPVQTLVLPYGWEYLCSLILKNGFALHDGFSDWVNGALFYRPDFRSTQTGLARGAPTNRVEVGQVLLHFRKVKAHRNGVKAHDVVVGFRPIIQERKGERGLPHFPSDVPWQSEQKRKCKGCSVALRRILAINVSSLLNHSCSAFCWPGLLPGFLEIYIERDIHSELGRL